MAELGSDIAILPSLQASADVLRQATSKVLITTFTDAGGLLTALNWAAHLAAVGQRPTIGLDGPLPRVLERAGEWRATRTLAYAVREGQAAANGLERWTVRWVGLAALLDLGLSVVLSDTDVVWQRDPVPYMAALMRLHPRLDLAVGTDHATYAEMFRDDVLYASTTSPTRRSLLAQWQRVNTSSSGREEDELSSAPDFDLDPHPANGARDGTWNPGVLFARATVGGRAFVAAELAAMATAGDNLAARGLESAAQVSDQSEMCHMIQNQLLGEVGSGGFSLSHASLPEDPALLLSRRHHAPWM